MRVFLVGTLIWGGVAAGLPAQTWEIPFRQGVILDGHLNEWSGVGSVVLEPGRPGIRTDGDFGSSDLSVTIRAVWNEEGLYLAVEWLDDHWDIREVRRRDAVFVTPNRERRDRMLFFDNLKLHFHELEFDYLLWLSPRVEGRGPFFWHRRLLGVSVRESATRDPVITPREHDAERVTLEILLEWKELELKPKRLRKRGLPLTITVADSDSPGTILEAKLGNIKQLEWNGSITLLKKP